MKWVSFYRSFAVLALAIFVIMPVGARSQPPVKFRTKATYESGGFYANSVFLGDLNGDGHLDLIAANACPIVGCSSAHEGVVSVRLGNGDGTFQAPRNYASGGNIATSVAAGDVNGDGKPDLVVANLCRRGKDCSVDDTGEVSVLLGNGDGTFQPAVSYHSGGYSPRSVAIADVNRDGKADLLVANECDSLECAVNVFGSVGVLLGDGNGTFQPPVSYGTGSGHAISIATGHLNGDGNVDLAVANQCLSFDGTCNAGLGEIGVLLGNGNGTFQAAVTYYSGAASTGSVAVEDVSGDGHPDLVVTDNITHGYGQVGIMLNNGDGTFQAAVLHNAGGDQATGAAVGDINGDGFPDIAVVIPCQNNTCLNGKVSFLPGVGGGAFTAVASANASGGFSATAVVIGELNGDGRPDVVVANACADLQTCANGSGSGSVSVLLNSLILATTTTAVTSSSNPVRVNQPVTLTATVSSNRPVPNGEIVTFSIGTVKIGTGKTTNGVATLTRSFSTAKTYTIKASYAGFDFLGPSSATLQQVVNP